MSAAIAKITKDEIHSRLQGWLCECATIEEEWDIIADMSFSQVIRQVEKEYVGGVANFLVDAFPESK